MCLSTLEGLQCERLKFGYPPRPEMHFCKFLAAKNVSGGSSFNYFSARKCYELIIMSVCFQITYESRQSNTRENDTFLH